MTRFCTMFADQASSDAGREDAAAEPIVLLIDLDRRLIDASATAELLLAEETTLERSFGRLAAKSQRDMMRIDRALNEARWRGMASLRMAGGAFEADVVRLGADRRSPRFLILSRQAEGAGRSERAAKRFGLTPAENRLLQCLLDGLALKEAALRLGVARTTARTHLQRIFDKTGVRRQTELQRVIAGV